MPDPAAILAKHWPTDGPHTRDRLASAAEMLPGLLRYATTATDPVNARDTLQVPSDVRHLVVALHDVVGFLPQLLTQLQQTTAGMAESGLLRDERADVEQAWMGAETGRDLDEALAGALPVAAMLKVRLADARSHSTHLGCVEPQTAGPTYWGGPR